MGRRKRRIRKYKEIKFSNLKKFRKNKIKNDWVYHRSAHHTSRMLFVGCCWDRSSAPHFGGKKFQNVQTVWRSSQNSSRVQHSHRANCLFHARWSCCTFYTYRTSTRTHSNETKKERQSSSSCVVGFILFLATHNVLYAEAGRPWRIHRTGCWRGRRR